MDEKNKPTEQIDQYVCHECQSRMLRLLLVKGLPDNKTQLQLLCQDCGDVIFLTLIGTLEEYPAAEKKKLDYV